MTTLTDKYLFYVTILQAIICTIGILLNSPIIYITIKYKNLHRTYGYYLVICVILDMLFEFSSALPLVLVVMQIYIPLLTCFYVQWYGTFSNIVVMALNLIIGIDRLFSVLFPFYFTKFEKKYAGRTVLFTTFIACLYGFFLVQYMLRYALANPNKLVYCQITDIVQGDAQVIGYYATFILNGLILFIYVLIWILIKLLKNQDMIAIRIFKTLAILMGTILCLWLAQSLIVNVILPQLGLSADTQYLIVRLCSQTVRVASALNTPILYFCNSEYRTILRIEFNRIFQWCKNRNTNIATGPNNQLIPASNTLPINVVRPSNSSYSSALMRQIQV